MSEPFVLTDIPDADRSPERAEILRRIIRGLPREDIDDMFLNYDLDAAESHTRAVTAMLSCVEEWLDLGESTEYGYFYEPGCPCRFLLAGGFSSDSPPTDAYELFDRIKSIPSVYRQLKEWACEDLKLRDDYEPVKLYVVSEEREGVPLIHMRTLNEQLARLKYHDLILAERVPASAGDQSVVEINGKWWQTATDDFKIGLEEHELN